MSEFSVIFFTELTRSVMKNKRRHKTKSKMSKSKKRYICISFGVIYEEGSIPFCFYLYDIYSIGVRTTSPFLLLNHVSQIPLWLCFFSLIHWKKTCVHWNLYLTAMACLWNSITPIFDIVIWFNGSPVLTQPKQFLCLSSDHYMNNNSNLT